MRRLGTGHGVLPRAGDDSGSGTVLVVAVVGVVLVLAAAVGLLARAQAARSGAQGAADLGALAAAASIAVPEGVVRASDLGLGRRGRSPDGSPGGPCALAVEVVGRNGAVVLGCTVLPGGVVQVAAARRTVVGTARAVARAGPASARDP